MKHRNRDETPPPPLPDRVFIEYTCPLCPDYRIAFSTEDTPEHKERALAWMARSKDRHLGKH